MKIKINENETYEFKMDEDISFHKLKEIVKKIEVLCGDSTPEIIPSQRPKKYKKKTFTQKNNDLLKDVKCINCNSQRLYKKGFAKDGGRRMVCKNCNVSFTVPINGGQPIKARKRMNTKWNRDEAINAYKVHYFGNSDDKIKYAEKINANSWDNVAKALSNLRKRFNIVPQEIGLEEFPVLRGQSIAGKKANLKSQVQEEHQSEQSEHQSLVQPTPQPPLEVKKEGEREVEERPKWWNRK